MDRELKQRICARFGVPDMDLAEHKGAEALGIFAAAYRAEIHFEKKKVLILADGEETALADTVARLGAEKVTVLTPSRDGTFAGLDGYSDTEILIHASGGDARFASEAPSPVPDLGIFPDLEGVVETVANPLRTRLLLDAEEADLKCVGGLFAAVAASAVQIGEASGERIPEQTIDRVYRELLTEKANIVLAAAPGIRVDEVAKRLAEWTGKERIRVPAIRETVWTAGGQEGKILSVGEEIARKDAFRYPITRNARAYFLSYPLDDLKEGSDPGGEMARVRELLPAFRSLCDRVYEYRGDAEGAARDIFRDFLRSPYLKRET